MKKNHTDITLLLPTLYFMLTCVVTSVVYRKIFAITIAIAFAFIVVAIKLATDNKFVNCFDNTATYLGLLQIFYILLISLVVKAEYKEHIQTYLKSIIILFFIWTTYLMLKNSSKSTIKFLVKAYLIVIAICTCCTIYIELTGPENVIRDTAAGKYFPSILPYGGYDFIYSLVLIYSALVVYLSLNKKEISKVNKLWITFLLVIMFLAIALSNYSTALIFIVVATVIASIMKFKHKFLLAIAILIIIYASADVLAAFVRSLPLSDLTTSRISDVILSLTGKGSANDHLTGDGQRWDRTLWSFKIFADYPIFGGFVSKAGLKFGFHTEWIDQMARYGVIYIIIHLIFFIKARKTIINDCETQNSKLVVKIVFYFLLALGFFNPITLVVTVSSIFLLCPFLDDIFLNKDN